MTILNNECDEKRFGSTLKELMIKFALLIRMAGSLVVAFA